MSSSIAYVAGPDVFKPNARDIYKGYVDLCKQNDVECLYPCDETIEPSDTKEGFAQNIYTANLRMMGMCDFVLVNVEPFRGPSMDVGAAFEIGYARAKGKPIFGFWPQGTPMYFQRLKDFYGDIQPGDLGLRSTADGVLLEDFGLSENLMIAKSLKIPVQIGFEAALKEALRVCGKTDASVSHERPDSDFPQWLKAFDNANNQHARSLEILEMFFSKLAKSQPDEWRAKPSLNVLDLACGDGRFSSDFIKLFEQKLGKPINYAAADINAEFVESARKRFPNGTVTVENIFDCDLESLLPKGSTPDLIVLSHAIYFALDKRAVVERLSKLGNANTLTLYLLNDPIYRQITKDVEPLLKALDGLRLPYAQLDSFTSYILMPQQAAQHVSALLPSHTAQVEDEGFETTKNLLFFFQQSPLSKLEPTLRSQYLTDVLADLKKHGGKIPVQNHLIAALRRDASDTWKQAVQNALLGVAAETSA